MFIRMDTDAVKAMASRLRQTADSMELRLSSIKQSVNGAGWQSQAREEFIIQVETLSRSTARSVMILRLMARAADRKADQWEAIANIFNGPFYLLEGIWESVRNSLGEIWGGFLDRIGAIRFPSLPRIILPLIPGAVVVGGISKLIPDWADKDVIARILPWRPVVEKDRFRLPDEGIKDPDWYHPIDRIKPGEEKKPPVERMPYPVNPPSDEKPMPRQLTNPTLQKVTGDPASYTCATYARARRPDLGSTQSNHEQFADGAAANYISKFNETSFQLDGGAGDLRETIGPGYALVWEPKHPSANSTYGHVAIIEEVYGDHVIISEASSWPSGTYQIKTRKISIDQLNDDLVWLIP